MISSSKLAFWSGGGSFLMGGECFYFLFFLWWKDHPYLDKIRAASHK